MSMWFLNAVQRERNICSLNNVAIFTASLFNQNLEAMWNLLNASSPEMKIGLLNVPVSAGPGLSVPYYHQARGSLGANTASSIAGATGITILIINLKKSSAYIHIHSCQKYFGTEKCFMASFSAVCIILCGKTKILGPNVSKKPFFLVP